MLPAHIIEEIRRRELVKRRSAERPQIELPLPQPYPKPETEQPSDRGVIVIDLM